MSEHSRIPPSSAERWVPCPGSVVMQERYPQDEDSEQSREGTAAHWVASAILEHARGGSTSEAQNFINQTAPNGVIITEEMTEAADLYAQEVLSICNTPEKLQSLQIEKRVTVRRVHEESWGTPDAWWYDSQTGILYVWDFKYGHRVVQPYENWQMVNYSIGLLDLLFAGTTKHDITVDIRVVQPRSYHHEGPIRTWAPRSVMLRSYANRLESSAVEALGDDPRTCSGPWCRDCTGRSVCRTLQESALCAVDMIGDLSADTLPPDSLGMEILTLQRAADAVKYRLEALQAQAIETLLSGTLIAGWRTREGKGRQKWDKPNAEVFALGDCMEIELRKDPEPVTPKQAIKAGIDAAVISAYSVTPSTGLKLIPDDGSKAKRVFTQP